MYAAKSFSDSDGFDENSDPISNIIPPFPNPPGNYISHKNKNDHLNLNKF